ncbi:MAG: hypothetical protein COV71_03680 [Candidatus Omnitrophica bacterium CG11_big_fil_rev_8_21_14_0_20_41_12]|nr:MAG: hypothetical protein COV71_03680 [Candidatus Omnitrophica bacterium CG11_big_fil_rev_8_21_14_0_20_41_12]
MNKKIERINNVSVLDIELALGKLTVWRKKIEFGRAVDVLTTFFVAETVQIKDVYGSKLPFFKIRPGSRVNVDYVKEKDGRFIVLNVVVITKLYRRR